MQKVDSNIYVPGVNLSIYSKVSSLENGGFIFAYMDKISEVYTLKYASYNSDKTPKCTPTKLFD